MTEKKAVIQSSLNKARDDKFLLVFDLPLALKQQPAIMKQLDTYSEADAVQFAVAGTAVPEIVVPAVETRWGGNTLYISSHSKNSYPPVGVKFKIDNEYNNYWVIYQWLNLMHDEYHGHYDPKHLTDVEYFNDFRTDLTIYGLDEHNEKKIAFTYKGAFPTAIEEVTYDYKEGTEISSGFRFVYSQLHTELIK